MWKRQDDLIARLTIRGYLVLLTLAIMVPVLVFAAILYFRLLQFRTLPHRVRPAI